VLNGAGPDLQVDFVQMFPDNRSRISDTIEALTVIGGGAWEVVDDRSTATVTRMTIQAPGSRRYDIAYRSVGDTYGMFVAMPRSVDEASVGKRRSVIPSRTLASRAVSNWPARTATTGFRFRRLASWLLSERRSTR